MHMNDAQHARQHNIKIASCTLLTSHGPVTSWSKLYGLVMQNGTVSIGFDTQEGFKGGVANKVDITPASFATSCGRLPEVCHVLRVSSFPDEKEFMACLIGTDNMAQRL